MKRTALIVCAGLICGVVSLAASNMIENLRWRSVPLSHPAPPPKPTMTITLRIGENFTKKLTLDIPTEEEPSWKDFIIDPDMLKPDENGEVRCRLFLERDANP